MPQALHILLATATFLASLVLLKMAFTFWLNAIINSDGFGRYITKLIMVGQRERAIKLCHVMAGAFLPALTHKLLLCDRPEELQDVYVKGDQFFKDTTESTSRSFHRTFMITMILGVVFLIQVSLGFREVWFLGTQILALIFSTIGATLWHTVSNNLDHATDVFRELFLLLGDFE